MKEATPNLLQVPELALCIISHLDPPTIPSMRLVSFAINNLILTHQRSISRCIAQRQFSTDIDWPPPDISCLDRNYHLRIICRLPKADTLARRANKNLECHVEGGRTKIKGKWHAEATVIKPASSYPAFLGRCTRAILIIWTLNDIRRHFYQPEPLPRYIPPPPPPTRQERVKRLFSRIKKVPSKLESAPASASRSPIGTNAQNLSRYISFLAPRSEDEVKEHLSAFDAARQTYLKSLSRNHLIDLVWVQDYLFIGLARNPRSRRTTQEQLVFLLQQGPDFILSWCSSDQWERGWALDLVQAVVHARQSEFSLDEWGRIIPFVPEEDGLAEEAQRAKGELTRGDWRNR